MAVAKIVLQDGTEYITSGEFYPALEFWINENNAGADLNKGANTRTRNKFTSQVRDAISGQVGENGAVTHPTLSVWVKNGDGPAQLVEINGTQIRDVTFSDDPDTVG